MQAITHRSQKSPSYTVSADKTKNAGGSQNPITKSPGKLNYRLSIQIFIQTGNIKYANGSWINAVNGREERSTAMTVAVRMRIRRRRREMLTENLMLTKITTPISFVLTFQTMRRRSAIEWRHVRAREELEWRRREKRRHRIHCSIRCSSQIPPNPMIISTKQSHDWFWVTSETGKTNW